MLGLAVTPSANAVVAAPVGCRPLGLWRLQNLAQRRECPGRAGMDVGCIRGHLPGGLGEDAGPVRQARLRVTHPRRCGASNDFARLSRAKFLRPPDRPCGGAAVGRAVKCLAGLPGQPFSHSASVRIYQPPAIAPAPPRAPHSPAHSRIRCCGRSPCSRFSARSYRPSPAARSAPARSSARRFADNTSAATPAANGVDETCRKTCCSAGRRVRQPPRCALKPRRG